MVGPYVLSHKVFAFIYIYILIDFLGFFSLSECFDCIEISACMRLYDLLKKCESHYTIHRPIKIIQTQISI